MKKIIALLLACVMVLGLFAACGGNDTPDTTAANTPDTPDTPDTTAGEPAATGSVYYLNFKPEADQAWQELAAVYTDKTGVPVKVVTAASGTYSDTLTAEIAKDEPVTMYNVGNAQAVVEWADYTLDLADTAFAGELATDAFNLYDEAGALKAAGYCYESFGIIVNVDLLEQAGHSLDEIVDFTSLKAVAEDIHARAGELGFDAFTSSGLDGSSSWRFSGHLLTVPLHYEFAEDGITEQPATIKGTYVDYFKNLWDLYITNTSADAKTLTTSTGDEAKAMFTEGKAVFHQQGSWEYAGLTEAGMTNLAMIPLYCGAPGEEKAGLASGTENCWAVNSQASEEDIKATLDFMYWVVTSEEGTTMLAEQFGAVPFKAAKTPENVFCANANAYTAAGNYNMNWAFNHTPNVDAFRATVVTALAAYSADPTDANWETVVSAIVDGWAYEYNMQNG